MDRMLAPNEAEEKLVEGVRNAIFWGQSALLEALIAQPEPF